MVVGCGWWWVVVGGRSRRRAAQVGGVAGIAACASVLVNGMIE